MKAAKKEFDFNCKPGMAFKKRDTKGKVIGFKGRQLCMPAMRAGSGIPSHHQDESIDILWQKIKK